MQEFNSCVGCQYFNKPYWNMINTCSNCPKYYQALYSTNIMYSTPSTTKERDIVEVKWRI